MIDDSVPEACAGTGTDSSNYTRLRSMSYPEALLPAGSF